MIPHDVWLVVSASLLVVLAGLFSAADAAVGAFSHARAEQLVAEADAEQRLAGVEQLADHRRGVFGGRGGIAGAVGEEDAVGLERHHLVEGGGGGDDGDLRAGLDEVAEDVALRPVIDRDDVGARLMLPFRGAGGVGGGHGLRRGRR